MVWHELRRCRGDGLLRAAQQSSSRARGMSEVGTNGGRLCCVAQTAAHNRNTTISLAALTYLSALLLLLNAVPASQPVGSAPAMWTS